jgi:dTDP-4-dehydrorhamnose 3,5-epimerase
MKHHTPPERQRINGVQVKTLRPIPDERGWLMEILRRDETDLLPAFGQVYVSATYPGVVKAWHYHKTQIDNFACVAGMVKPYSRESPDEFRVDPHGTLAYDWRGKDG